MFQGISLKGKFRSKDDLFVVALFLLALLFLVPIIAKAGMSEKADAMCVPVKQECFCGMFKDQKGNCRIPGNKFMCECFDTPPGGKVTGTCVGNYDCKGEGSTNQQGQQQGMGDAKGMMDMMKSLMDSLKGKGGGGGGGDQSQQPQQNQQQACTSFYQVSVPSSDPCAYYTPPVSTSFLTTGTESTEVTSSLLDLLKQNDSANTSVSVDVSDSDTKSTTKSETYTEDTKGTAKSSTHTESTVKITPNVLTGKTDVGKGRTEGGTYGDIVVTEKGGTIYAGSRDVEKNVEVAGFFGGDTISEKVQGAVAGMCQKRPWAGSIISYVLPATFFDGLCTWRGYEVGEPPPDASDVLPPAAPIAPITTQTKTSIKTPPKSPPVQGQPKTKVDIWAVPMTVSLGARASVFWNTTGVESCEITSSEGNFDENKLSGGSATVPLTRSTTFRISCVTSDQINLTDEVTVSISQ